MIRLILILLAVPCGLLGAYGLGAGLAPDQSWVGILRGGVEALGSRAGQAGLPDLLAGVVPGGVLSALALGALFGAVKMGGAGGSADGDAGALDELSATDPRLARKVEKQASKLAKRGQVAEAAELCFVSGIPDKAAGYFEDAGELVRAAEIRHDQSRFKDAADLYVRAGQFDTAGTIYAAQDAFAESADCYHKAGRMSVAAEMYEKANNPLKAGECYEACEFHRYAARSFIQAQQWARAAKSLEEVVREEGPRQNDPGKREELRKLVLQTAKLHEQAGDLPSALRVLENGECWSAAAEVALRLDEVTKAAELFQRAGDGPRAAEALRGIGESTAAAQILGEHLREQGEDEEAARLLVQAGEFIDAGDLYRNLEDFQLAGECYERAGDGYQSGEMFRLAGNLERAAGNYERAGQHDAAADCFEKAGDSVREAASRVKAGQYLEAGQILHREGRDDQAIEALQQIAVGDEGFSAAAIVLAEMFRGRGNPALAVTRLQQATAQQDVGPDNVGVFYALAVSLEEGGKVHESREVYERINASQYNYEDVEARLHRLRELAESLPPSPSATSNTTAANPAVASRYRVESELGRGGMGIVYRATDSVLDRTVAFKVLPDALRDNPQALKNFLREAKSAAKLNHPNIVTVYDAGEQQGRFYIAMEYVDGTTLKEIVRRRGAIAPNGVLHVALQMAEALGYAHSQKVVHRDIKTANAMWTREKQAKIMDFGLAKVVEEVRNHTTLVSGTPYYMSPEQTLGKNVDHRTDLYSLGVTLFELATGALPFTEGNVPYHHVHTPPPDPRDVNPKLPAPVAALISKCMQKDPAHRYQQAGELAAEIRGLSGSTG